MNTIKYYKKVVNGNRKYNRFRSLKGDYPPFREILSIPKEGLLRLLGIHRKGPWMNKDVIRYLTNLLENDFKGKGKVLEIGGGESTRFFKEKCSSVTTIEEDSIWADKILEYSSNVIVGDTVKSLKAIEQTLTSYDLALVDGGSDKARIIACEILYLSNPKIIIVLDNSDRDIFSVLDSKLSGKEKKTFIGLIRSPFQVNETSIFE